VDARYIAAVFGLPDGQQMSPERVLDAVRSIVAATRLPASADLEGGYASDPEGVYALVSAMLRAGAVGINIKDGAHLLSPQGSRPWWPQTPTRSV
jgi:2-methylisocitrate lyase-like PEP mutase family enzyme